MSSSVTVTELCTQLRLLLEVSPDAISLNELLARVDAFVLECSESPEADALLTQLEDELQVIYDDILGHTLPQADIFLAFLHHLCPVLPSTSIITTWFDLVLRPTLREPKLPLHAVNYAKELIIHALDPGSKLPVGSPEAEKQKERIGDFRRRLMDLYLLDAYNESSGDDVLEWAELDQEQREKKACWKANLEDILIRVGLERPQDFLTEVYHCFILPTSRLQLLILLNAYTSHPNFPDHAHQLASHPLLTSLLYSLVFDGSSTVCTIALNVLIKLLPIFAVQSCDQLKRLLPMLLLVLARILCWKERQSTTFPKLPVSEPEETDEEDEGTSGTDDHRVPEGSRPIPIHEDIQWTRLELTFDGPTSEAPSPHRYFTFLYYLFPCNTIRFLRYPVRYLNDNKLERLYAIDWKAALDEDKIRSKSERLLRMHVLHPLLIWREAKEELEQPDFWAQYDIPRIVGGATMLDVRHVGLASRQQQPLGAIFPQETPPPERGRTSRPLAAVQPIPSPPPVEAGEATDTVQLSSSLETVHPESDIRAPLESAQLKISLMDMVTTSVALRSGLDVDIVEGGPAWSTTLFPLQPPTRSPSRHDHESLLSTEGPVEAPVAPAMSEHETQGEETLPRHVAQAISGLQREVLLLKNDLNLELWTARENVQHIGRLYQERVLSRNEETERQGLHNKLKEYKHMVTRLRRELKEGKDQAVAQRLRYTDWNKELQDRITALRAEKKAWMSEAAAMRAVDKEAKDTFAAQGKLLAEATQAVFRLKTQIKENAHKVDRLHDYETQIDQLIKLQRLWESDVQKLNDSKEYLTAFASKYRKMELALIAYEKSLAEVEEHAAEQRHQILVLENKVEQYEKQLETERRTSGLHKRGQQLELLPEWRKTQEANVKLRSENETLRSEIEEVQAMVEVLKGQVRGRTGLIDSPLSSPTR